MASPRLVGITVMPEYFQSESVNGVLDRLQRQAAVTAVTTSPYVMEAADRQTGVREPPIDAGAGKVRLLDRTLWGKRELWVRTAPSFQPDPGLYRGLRYQPPAASGLTREQGPLVGEFIRNAQSRGLKVYLQVQAAIPPGYRVQFGQPEPEDCPRLPDGSVPRRRLSANGSLASPHIRDYTLALLRDLCRQYPTIDGLRLDWPEYPPYLLDSIFVDFGEQARKEAERMGFDFDRMRNAAAALYRRLHGELTDGDLRICAEAGSLQEARRRRLPEAGGLDEWIGFKAGLVESLHAGFRQVINDAGGGRMELRPNAFPPPWNIFSGLDYRRVSRYSSALSVKLYTMHWPMMLRFYGDRLRQTNPGVSEPLLVKALTRLFDTGGEPAPARLEDLRYPDPEDPHPVGAAAQHRKIAQAQLEAGTTPVCALVHGYGPTQDFRARLETAQSASRHGFWINRYGHLSDEKLGIVGEVARLT